MAAARVTHALCIGVNLPDWPAVHALAMAHPNLYATRRRAPDAENTPEPTVDALVALAAQPKVMAIGETGLDYYRLAGDLGWQRERFRCISAPRCGRESRWWSIHGLPPPTRLRSCARKTRAMPAA